MLPQLLFSLKSCMDLLLNLTACQSPGCNQNSTQVSLTLLSGILCVQEIKGWDTVTRIPNAPAHIKGVINLRGAIIPLITETDDRSRYVLERHVCVDTTAAGGNAAFWPLSVLRTDDSFCFSLLTAALCVRRVVSEM